MQFYPHQVPLSTVGSATSASIAKSGSYIANFSSIPVATASFATNISGSAGTNGTNISVTGPKGATGARGVTGFRGKSVFLLSGSWHNGSPCNPSPPACYIQYFGQFSPTDESTGTCVLDESVVWYSTNQILSSGVSVMYYNSTCTSRADSVTLGAWGPANKEAFTDGIGVFYDTGRTCSNTNGE